MAILANERMDQVVTSTSHAARASELSTVPARGYDDGLDFPLTAHPEREPLKGRCHVRMYMDPARLETGLANSGPRVTTADVYPASLCGLNDRRREPRWILARFTSTTPSIGQSHACPDTRFGKRRSDRFAIFCQPLQLLGETYRSFHFGICFQAAPTERLAS